MSNQIPFELGVSGKVSQEMLLGKVCCFDDTDRINRDAQSGVAKLLSGMKIFARLVRNETGSTLAAGLIVEWDTGTTYGPGKAVKTIAGDDEYGCGVVDPYLSSSVADDDFFWLIHTGPTYVQSDGNAIANPNTRICCDASGQVRAWVAGTDEPDSVFGVNIDAAPASAGTLYRALVRFPYIGL